MPQNRTCSPGPIRSGTVRPAATAISALVGRFTDASMGGYRRDLGGNLLPLPIPCRPDDQGLLIPAVRLATVLPPQRQPDRLHGEVPIIPPDVLAPDLWADGI